MSAIQKTLQSDSDPEKVISPFSDRQTDIQDSARDLRKLAWISGSVVAVMLVAAALILTIHYLENPFRAMEVFPVERYFENYQTLAGSKYRAELRVEADLGWKDNAGRLMLFSSGEDPRPFGILIPVSVANGITFSKGQVYTAEIEVKEGGLIYADSFRKD